MGEHSQIAIERVQAWVNKFVTKRHPLLGDFPPCPFARKSMMSEKVHWQVCSSLPENLGRSAVEQCAATVLAGSFDIGIVIDLNPKAWSLQTLNEFVERWRAENIWRDLTVLRDHPDDEEIVSGVKMNQGEYLLFFVQRISKLSAARQELDKLGYYSRWSAQEIKTVTGTEL